MLPANAGMIPSRWTGAKPYGLDELYAVSVALGVPVADIVLPHAA